LLDRALDTVANAERVIVVGPKRATSRPVTWARERPPGGGPVAAIEAGLGRAKTERVVVVAVDLPLLGKGHIEALARADDGMDGAIFVDDNGVDQPLAGIYRATSLRRALRRLPKTSGASVRMLVEKLELVRVHDSLASTDCDTPDDVIAIERELNRR
jgi:molybdopterin-guanine dinucleotide biosynthesis protein A